MQENIKQLWNVKFYLNEWLEIYLKTNLFFTDYDPNNLLYSSC